MLGHNARTKSPRLLPTLFVSLRRSMLVPHSPQGFIHQDAVPRDGRTSEAPPQTVRPLPRYVPSPREAPRPSHGLRRVAGYFHRYYVGHTVNPHRPLPAAQDGAEKRFAPYFHVFETPGPSTKPTAPSSSRSPPSAEMPLGCRAVNGDSRKDDETPLCSPHALHKLRPDSESELLGPALAAPLAIYRLPSHARVGRWKAA